MTRVAADCCGVIALDVGGSSIKAGVIGPGGLLRRCRVPTERERGADAVIATIRATLGGLAAASHDAGIDVVGAAVAVPGIVDDEAGIGRYSVTFGWRDRPIRDEVASSLRCPITLTHDVRAGGLAEATFGAARDTRAALFVPIGTGLAAAVITDGAVRAGSTQQAGEFGQLLVAAPPTGRDHASGDWITVERASSARALAERYERAAGAAVDAAEVVERAARGDVVAVAVFDEAMDRLGLVLAGAVATLDPDVVVVGGGLSRSGGVLVAGLARALQRHLPWRQPPRVAVAHFAADAGFVGAALTAWDRAAGLDVAGLAGVLAATDWTVAT